MVYANDVWAQLPVKDLYDSQMMLASVEAAKDMYEKGAKAMDDFYKTYGDFQSPFSKDMEEYADMINRPVNIVNKLYENGIDPLRSAEGRAAVQQAIREFSIPKYNQMKANAAVGYEYLKNMADLQSKGLYDENMENFFLTEQGLPSFGEFSTGQHKTWGRFSPIQAKTLNEVIDPLVENIKPHDVMDDQLYLYDLKPVEGYRWIDGISEVDLENAIKEGVPGIANNPYYRYYQNMYGDKMLSKSIDAVRGRIKNPDMTLDEIWKMNKDYSHDMNIASMRSGGEDDSDNMTIFDVADYYDWKQKSQGGIDTTGVSYNPSGEIANHGITPMSSYVRRAQAGDGGDAAVKYDFNELSKAQIYIQDEEGHMQPVTGNKDNYEFVTDGRIIKHGDGHYIKGTVNRLKSYIDKEDKNKRKNRRYKLETEGYDNNGTYWMKVREGLRLTNKQYFK